MVSLPERWRLARFVSKERNIIMKYILTFLFKEGDSIVHGPYKSKEEAEDEVSRFMARYFNEGRNINEIRIRKH